MELTTLKTELADTGAILYVEHPSSGEVIPDMWVQVLGTDSKAAADQQKRRNRAALKRLERGKKAAAFDLDDIEEQTLDDIAALTVGWGGFEEGGEPVECTPANVKRVYTDYPWLREQVQAFHNDRANFFTSSANG